jgi:2-oxoglutarate ferredoxin oxidoreductase subunit alpha
VYVVEQNRDAKMRSLLINELEINPKKLIRVLNYDGFPITAEAIRTQVQQHHPALTPVGANGQNV